MLERISITYIFLALVCWNSYEMVTLPRWVHRVDFCPDPNNISQWVEASHRLNCYHDLTSKDPLKQAVVYHCLPSSFLNETVEFCGTNVPVAPGNCPVYNYQFGVNVAASYYDCSAFASGCPKEMFHSKNVFLQPECMKINRKEKCFEAHVNCTKSSSNESLTITTGTVLVEQTRMTDKNDDSERIDSIPLLSLVLSFVVIIVLLLIVIGCFVRDKRKHRLRKKTNFCSEAPDLHEAELTPLFKEGIQEHEELSSKDSSSEASNVIPTNKADTFITEQELEELRKKDENQRENGNSDSGSDDSGYGQERKALLENMLEAATEWNFNEFIENLKESMKLEMFERIKHRIHTDRKKENSQTEVDDIKDKDDLLKYLNEKYHVYQNVEFLQGLFLSCNAPKLYEICLKYAQARKNDMRYFEKKILKEDHTKVVYVINCPKLSSYKRSELAQLRKILATLLKAQYDDILVCGVKEGCVIVTFMIRNCLLPSLKAFYESEKRNTTCQWELKFKIMKVMIEDRVVYMSDLLSTVKGLKAEAELSLNSPESELNADEIETRICKPIDNDNFESFGNLKKGCPTKDALGEILKQESHKFKDFVENSLCSMTDDTLNFIKKELQYFTDEKSVKKMDRTAALHKMSDMLKLQYNMDYLVWLFDQCSEHTLLERCQKFSSENTFVLKTFQAAVSPGHGRQTLEFHIMVSDLESYSDEILNLRCWIAKSINISPGEILMTALKTAPIVVTFMMRKKHCGAFLEFVETDDGQIAASRKRVEKIINNGKVITFENAVNGEKFVHIHLRYDKDSPKGLKKKIRNASSLVLNALGIKMEGREVYVRHAALDNQENDKGESWTFIENNKKHLLDNLEPCTLVTNHDIASLFDEGTISNMNGKKSRREKIDYFFEMCNGLPKRQFDVVLPYLEKCLSSSKTITSSKECDAIRSWFQENRENVIEEMDSDVIDTTCNINNMEAVSTEIGATLSAARGRKEKAELFLDFALRNDEYLKALKKTLEENGMRVESD